MYAIIRQFVSSNVILNIMEYWHIHSQCFAYKLMHCSSILMCLHVVLLKYHFFLFSFCGLFHSLETFYGCNTEYPSERCKVLQSTHTASDFLPKFEKKRRSSRNELGTFSKIPMLKFWEREKSSWIENHNFRF